MGNRITSALQIFFLPRLADVFENPGTRSRLLKKGISAFLPLIQATLLPFYSLPPPITSPHPWHGTADWTASFCHKAPSQWERGASWLPSFPPRFSLHALLLRPSHPSVQVHRRSVGQTRRRHNVGQGQRKQHATSPMWSRPPGRKYCSFPLHLFCLSLAIWGSWSQGSGACEAFFQSAHLKRLSIRGEGA